MINRKKLNDTGIKDILSPITPLYSEEDSEYDFNFVGSTSDFYMCSLSEENRCVLLPEYIKGFLSQVDDGERTLLICNSISQSITIKEKSDVENIHEFSDSYHHKVVAYYIRRLIENYYADEWRKKDLAGIQELVEKSNKIMYFRSNNLDSLSTGNRIIEGLEQITLKGETKNNKELGNRTKEIFKDYQKIIDNIDSDTTLKEREEYSHEIIQKIKKKYSINKEFENACQEKVMTIKEMDTDFSPPKAPKFISKIVKRLLSLFSESRKKENEKSANKKDNNKTNDNKTKDNKKDNNKTNDNKTKDNNNGKISSESVKEFKKVRNISIFLFLFGFIGIAAVLYFAIQNLRYFILIIVTLLIFIHIIRKIFNKLHNLFTISLGKIGLLKNYRDKIIKSPETKEDDVHKGANLNKSINNTNNSKMTDVEVNSKYYDRADKIEKIENSLKNLYSDKTIEEYKEERKQRRKWVDKSEREILDEIYNGTSNDIQNALRKLKMSKRRENSEKGNEINIERFIQSKLGNSEVNEIFRERKMKNKGRIMVSLCMDFSGSMNKETTRDVMFSLYSATKINGDYLSISGFRHNSSKIVKLPNEEINWTDIEAINFRGRTPMSRGIVTGSRIIRKYNKRKIMFVLTDGKPNQFINKSGELPNIVEKLKSEQNINIIGIGIGDDIEEDTMREVFGQNYAMTSRKNIATKILELYKNQIRL